jgi:hypothetical protein
MEANIIAHAWLTPAIFLLYALREGGNFFGVRARWIAVVGGDPRNAYSSALGLAAALGLAFFGVHAS